MSFTEKLLGRRPAVDATASVIDVTSWARDEDFPVFPVGSKPKRRLTSPDEAVWPLLPGHSYLFKTATDWRVQQVWSEYVAYRFGAMLGLPVPPSFLAVDEDEGEFGILVEFFYGYPGAPSAVLLSGADILQRLGRNPGGDRPHGVATNIAVCRRFGLAEAEFWWTRLVTFDALIGNTDRHTENWGYLVPGPDGERIAMAPIFDNGTSLGYTVLDQKLDAALAEQQVNKYIAGGRHHLGWDGNDDARVPHIELVGRMIDAFAESEDVVRSLISYDPEELTKVLKSCVAVDSRVPFVEQRAQLVGVLIEQRRRQIGKFVGE